MLVLALAARLFAVALVLPCDAAAEFRGRVVGVADTYNSPREVVSRKQRNIEHAR
jgi:hypothetical protein